jgi:phospholipase A1/A2
MRRGTAFVGAVLLAAGPAAWAQGTPTATLPAGSTAPAAAGWQTCTTLAGDAAARLACFDGWAAQQRSTPATAATPASPPATASTTGPVDAALPATRVITVDATPGCRDRQYSELSRFWELETGTDCGTFGIRGYRPISLSLVGSSSVNEQPTSPNPLNNATTATPYRNTETRLQLSVRTKIASGLLTGSHPTLSDSLWFGYTQQSYWQVFTSNLSRPFRNTDHEPEMVYAYPTDAPLPGGWRLRYSGIGLVHQSNGQGLPLSRSWNRVYLMSGMEKGNDFRVQARLWRRLPEKNVNDDNPDVSDRLGRAEVSAFWHPNRDTTLGVTARHSLSSTRSGSLRLEWLRTLGGREDTSGLRLHTQLFTGYGDSLIDYNRRRTVLSVGLSLVDF